jgi:hypothetical protein
MAESYFVQNDGYTLWGFIRGRGGLYPDAWFKYRPAVPSITRRINETFGVQRDELIAELLSTRVDGLRVKKTDEPMPISADAAYKLHADLSVRLLNFVLGVEAPWLGNAEKNSPAASGSRPSTPDCQPVETVASG